MIQAPWVYQRQRDGKDGSAAAAAASATAAQAAQTAAETAETNAETAETNAETAETAAELAETNAAAWQSAAATSASQAATSATNAATSATNAATSATNAATSATAAQTAETNAELAETNAETAQAAAETAKTAAELAETNAETAETNAEAAAATIPPVAGNAMKFIRVNAGATAYEALADAAAVRSAIGLDTMATQAASAVAITGGSVGGITDLAVADGGTGASTAAGARTNLGLVIGTDVAAQSASPIGQHTIGIPAAAFWARTTNGAGAESRELATNDIMVKGWAFDQTTEEAVQFSVPMPKGWNEGTVTAVFYWTTDEGGAAETVVWGIRGLAVSNDDAMDAALGTEITVSDTWIADDDLHVSAESAAITLAGTPAESDLAIFQVARKVASDDLSGDAHLISVKLIFTTDAATDD